MDTLKPELTPLEVKQIKDIVSEPVENRPYRALVGCLMYACLVTRPDLSIAVNFFSQYQSKATKVPEAYFVLSSRDQELGGLWYRSHSETILVGYADADFANGVDRKSVTGYLFKLYGNLIVWVCVGV
ncbi:hypothetical protein B7P43_G04674 [Cryptotermes secundus]|uniref:Uncharacterized protein n=1 Tax=Cryptotermes secundus TaxID=105785 RepID=A0A2J7R1Q0_9NEOP|nr:secreted RxLR effector protein 161-like [Cryptotermes secundus]PNF34755.1 hypothetical protein B7P43_G04674 [Cryptotermes secundus]